jgi:hypothetical protein
MLELEKVRGRGFATDMSESEAGASCVVVAIHANTSRLRGAVSFSSLSVRFREDRLDEVVSDLRATADEIANRVRPENRLATQASWAPAERLFAGISCPPDSAESCSKAGSGAWLARCAGGWGGDLGTNGCRCPYARGPAYGRLRASR